MKRALAAILTGAMVFSLTACGSGSSSSAPQTAAKEETAAEAAETEAAAAETEAAAAETEAAAADSSEPFELVLGGCATSGSFYAYAVAAADIMNKYAEGVEVTVIPTAGGTENVKFMQTGEIDGGGGAFPMWNSAYHGENGWEEYSDMSLMFATYGDYVQLVTSADSDIETMQDLRGKRVNFEVAGNSSNENLRKMLSIIGIDPEKDLEMYEMSTTEAMDAIKEGTLDATFFQIGLNNSSIRELESSNVGLHVVAWDQADAEKVAAEWPVYVVKTIPAGTYKEIDHDITTIGGGTIISINDYVPEEVVYQCVKAVFEHQDELTVANANGAETVPELSLETTLNGELYKLHPGLEKYLKEAGLL